MVESPGRLLLYESSSSRIFLDKTSGDPPKVIKRFLSTSPDPSRYEECGLHSKCAAATPGVVRYLGMRTSGQLLEFEMDYCEQGSLRSVIEERSRTGNRWTEEELLNSYNDMMQTIRAIHNQRIVHRVIVAENWLMTANGSLKLTDFGHAKTVPPNASREPYRMADGTLSTQVIGEDVRFLANVFFHMAILSLSEQVFYLSSAQLSRRISIAGYSTAVSEIIMRMNKLGDGMRQVEVGRFLEELKSSDYNQLLDEDFGQELFDSPATFDPECSYCFNMGASRVLKCGHKICQSCVNNKKLAQKIKCNLCGRLFDFEATTELSHEQIQAQLKEASYHFDLK